MSRTQHTAPIPYVHPDDPADRLKPGEPFVVDGLDWSWAFVWYKSIPGFPGYCAGSNGTVWSRLRPGRPRTRRDPLPAMRETWTPLRPILSDGRMSVGLRNEGRTHIEGVHILILETFIGPRPPGLQGLHWDDNFGNNRLCNIRWGTPLDNSGDAKRNGRRPNGETHHNSKLTDADVREIRLAYAAGGVTNRQLADRYGLKASTIWAILTGKTWIHEETDIPSSRHFKLTGEKADQIRELAAGGMSRKQIAEQFGVCRSTVQKIVTGLYWAKEPPPTPGNSADE